MVKLAYVLVPQRGTSFFLGKQKGRKDVPRWDDFGIVQAVL